MLQESPTKSNVRSLRATYDKVHNIPAFKKNGTFQRALIWLNGLAECLSKQDISLKDFSCLDFILALIFNEKKK